MFVIFLKFAFSKSLASSAYIPTRGGKRSPGHSLWPQVPILCQPAESAEGAMTPLLLSPNPPSKSTNAHPTSILPPHSHTGTCTLEFVSFLGSRSPGLPPACHHGLAQDSLLPAATAFPLSDTTSPLGAQDDNQQQPLLWWLLPFHPSTFLHADILSWLQCLEYKHLHKVRQERCPVACAEVLNS